MQQRAANVSFWPTVGEGEDLKTYVVTHNPEKYGEKQ